jgi:XrtJ-associated TM-motif-TM protein
MIVKKFRTLFPFVLLLFVFSAARLHAQDDGGGLGGCENSPENPTLILGAIASAGGIGFVRLRRYLANRNNSDKK